MLHYRKAPKVLPVLLDTLSGLLRSPPTPCDPDTVRVLQGSTVLVTASHAVPHTRRAGPLAGPDRKKHDGATGQIAETIALISGASALIVCTPWTGNANADPLDLCPFKQTMVAMIAGREAHYVLDIHGMDARHNVDVCVGNGGTAPDALTESLCGLLVKSGLSYSINKPFAARGAGTVRANASAAGAWALQLEFAPHCRDPHRHPGPTGALLYALDRFVARLHDESAAT